MRTLPLFGRDMAATAPRQAATPAALPASVGAAAFVAGPLAMLAFHVLNGGILPRDDARAYLDQIATLGNRFPAATVAYLVAAALNLVIGLAFFRLLGGRPSGVIAGAFTMFSALGAFGFGTMNLVLWGLVDDLGVMDDLVRGYAAFQDGFGFLLLAAIAFPAAIIGTIALLVGLVRTRVTPLWVPVAIIAGIVVGSGEFGRGGNIAGAAIATLAGLGLALALLQQDAATA